MEATHVERRVGGSVEVIPLSAGQVEDFGSCRLAVTPGDVPELEPTYRTPYGVFVRRDERWHRVVLA